MEKEGFTRLMLEKGVRRQLSKVIMMPRYFTAKRRALPDFIIIGAQKAGTTSMYNYLVEHPDVLPVKTKEVHFFDEKFEKGLDWYRSYFPLKNELEGKITGEASPLYLYFPEVAERVKGVVPDVKIIVLFRNPAKRAISHIQHMIRKGIEKRSMEELFEGGFDARLALERSLSDPWKRKIFSYLDRGFYAEQLQPWFHHFNREQFLFLRSEDFYRDTPAAVAETLDFLGLPPYNGIDFKRAHNQHPYEKPDPALVQSLMDWFAPHNRELESLIGQKMHWD